MIRAAATALCVLALALGGATLGFSHGEMDHEPESPVDAPMVTEDTGGGVDVGVDEKPGDTLYTEGRLWNEKGEQVNLEEVLDLPTLLIPAYYNCPRSCSFLLAAMATAVRDLDLFPGMEYRVVALSFSEEETPADAAQAKVQYMKILGGGYPDEAWTFLVGDPEGIKKLCASMGYRYTRNGPNAYVHPNVALAVAPRGKIIRYLYGPDFLTADIKKGLQEAADGVASVSIRKVVTFCFDYDPESRGYVLNVYRTMGTVTLTLVGLMFLYLVVAPKVRKPKAGGRI
ncbi:SCO family protein [Desulfoluna spongiiphila]|uniref:Protein SCO1/2 n=1 Tax=Desulfoluna spongiiphila TaxID=419481 RepID=A0A1G5H2F1_9BACT|nr:SCO family protein [Desulfoluna spongiiphila]SCY58003.1 protein SCO1/2 [Desulfoluna spongiiphila]VVS94747.1 thioredoxin-like superfamily [Desulfoluna spongiiphila]